MTDDTGPAAAQSCGPVVGALNPFPLLKRLLNNHNSAELAPPLEPSPVQKRTPHRMRSFRSSPTTFVRSVGQLTRANHGTSPWALKHLERHGGQLAA